MKQNSKNTSSFFYGVFLILVMFSQVLSAQDSLFQIQAKKNIVELGNLYCWSEPDFYPGEYSISNNVDFKAELAELKLFGKFKGNPESYYEYLSELSLVEKQNLIRYFTYYETQFNAAGLPNDLKYLAPTLSFMNHEFVDNKQRAGVWQLTHFQGVLNGLQINRLVDERFNTEKATLAFAAQIKKNTNLFNSTELAVLAYWCGNAKIKNTLARCGENADYTEVVNKLPIEIHERISAFQAMAVFLRTNTFKANNTQAQLATIKIHRQVHFQQIEKVMEISQKELQFLNPEYRYSIIPGNKTVADLRIPAQKNDAFVLMSDSIYASYDSILFQVVEQKIEYAPAPSRQYVGEKVKDLEIEGKTKIKYIIQTGDVLGFIAEDYDVRVADLKYWNNIYNERKIQAGKTLDIFVDDEKADDYKSLQIVAKSSTSHVGIKTNAKPVGAIPPNARKVEHTVKSGESPYVIAKKYSGVTPEAILAWNGISDARKIQIGQKLIIYLAQ